MTKRQLLRGQLRHVTKRIWPPSSCHTCTKNRFEHFLPFVSWNFIIRDNLCQNKYIGGKIGELQEVCNIDRWIVFLEPGSDNIILQPNTYTYAFTVTVPVGAPSSYEAHIGRVRYCISASVDRPWAFDMHTKHMINVMQPLDLNTMPNLIVSYLFMSLRI